MQNYKFNRLTSNIVQDLLNKGYGVKDFELFVETFEGKLYFASFGNSSSGMKDFGAGDTEKFVSSSSHTLGFREHTKRDGSDIAENGKLINHKMIFKKFVKESKASATKEVNGVPKTSLLISVDNKRFIMAPSLELAKKRVTDELKIVDWSYSTKGHEGYKQNWEKHWKKSVQREKANSQELGKERICK